MHKVSVVFLALSGQCVAQGVPTELAFSSAKLATVVVENFQPTKGVLLLDGRSRDETGCYEFVVPAGVTVPQIDRNSSHVVAFERVAERCYIAAAPGPVIMPGGQAELREALERLEQARVQASEWIAESSNAASGLIEQIESEIDLAISKRVIGPVDQCAARFAAFVNATSDQLPPLFIYHGMVRDVYVDPIDRFVIAYYISIRSLDGTRVEWISEEGVTEEQRSRMRLHMAWLASNRLKNKVCP